MSDYLMKVMNLEYELEEFIEENIQFDLQTIISKIEKLLKKLTNDELIYVLNNAYYLHEYLNVADYFKKYKINKEEIKENNSYLETFKKVINFLERIKEASSCDEEYHYICFKCDIDNISKYLLKKMNNVDIMQLSNESDNWSYKLFLYGNLKN